MYAAGGGSQQAVVKALLEAARVQARMTLLVGDERAGAARLNALLGRPPQTPVGPLDEPASERRRVPSAEGAADALARHPEVRAAHRFHADVYFLWSLHVTAASLPASVIHSIRRRSLLGFRELPSSKPHAPLLGIELSPA